MDVGTHPSVHVFKKEETGTPIKERFKKDPNWKNFKTREPIQ